MSVVPVNKAYRLTVKTGDAIYIGDPVDNVFNPKVILNRWGVECWLKLNYDDSKIPKPQKSVKLTADNKVQWSTPLFDFVFYGMSEGDGGLEFEIMLKAKPPSNTFSFSIQTQNLRFLYQPPLTKELNPADCIELSETYVRLKSGGEVWRPENVVGSYAVYHATKTNLHRTAEEAEKYKTSKAYHIYRPKLTDNTGKTDWAGISIDEQQGTITIMLPQAFLDSAVYPVTVDPTFGYTSIGASEESDSTSYDHTCKYQTIEAGTVTKITQYIRLGTSGNAKTALYSDVSNLPNTLLAQSSEVAVGTTFSWVDFPISYDISASIYYWLDEIANQTHYFKYDTGGASGQWNQRSNVSYPTFTNPWGTGVWPQAWKMSIYATYTTGAVLKTVTDALSLSDTVFRNKPSLTITDSLAAADSVLRHKTLLPIADSVGVADIVFRNKPSLVITDVLGLSDSVLRNKVLAVLDSLGLSDAVLCNKTLAIADSVGASDMALGNKSPLIISDAVSLSEVIEVITGAIIKTVADTIGVSDVALINKTAIIADVVSALDQVFRHKPGVTITDVVTLAEVIAISRLIPIQDQINLSDIVLTLKQLKVADSITLLDSVSTPTRILQALDTIGLADNVLVNKTLLITDTISLVEVVEVGVGVKKTKLFLVIGDLAIQISGD